MIINVHGTKQKENPAPGQQHEITYELPRTRTPIIVAGVLGVIIAYVQSLFGRAMAVRPLEPDPEKSSNAQPANDEMLVADSGQQPVDPEAETEQPLTSSARFRLNWDLPDSVFSRIEVPTPPVKPNVLLPANGLDWTLTFPPDLPKAGAPLNFNRPSIPSYEPRPDQPVPLPQDSGTPTGPDTPKGNDGTDDTDDPDPPATPGNRAPRVSGPVILRDVAFCAQLVILGHHLLAHATDPDGDALAVMGLTASRGTIKWSDGQWIYEPEPFRTGPVTLSYKISDGKHFIDQTAYFSVVSPAPIIGTPGNDILIGGYCADDIYGGDGDDIIDGGAGNDIIHGGRGNDHIYGGLGDDIIYGGDGHDVIFGGPGNDQIFGGRGNDRLFGEDGDDTIHGEDGDDFIDGGNGDDYLSGGNGSDEIHGGAGNDFIDGGAGNDRLFGGAGKDMIFGGDGDDLIEGGDGDDRLFGEAGNDTIFGGDGDDHIDGGAGNDTIHDGAGRDTVFGGDGDDTIIAALDGDDDHFDGGAGHDTLDYSAATQSLAINLNAGTASSGEIGNDTFTGFETVIGGGGDDHFVFGEESAIIYGGSGGNVYEHVVPQSSGPTLFEIVDFKHGDLLKMSKYKIFEKVFDKLEDEFEKIYGFDIDDDDVRIRYRHEEIGNRAIIEADFNRDNIFETSIILHGSQALVFMEMT